MQKQFNSVDSQHTFSSLHLKTVKSTRILRKYGMLKRGPQQGVAEALTHSALVVEGRNALFANWFIRERHIRECFKVHSYHQSIMAFQNLAKLILPCLFDSSVSKFNKFCMSSDNFLQCRFLL